MTGPAAAGRGSARAPAAPTATSRRALPVALIDESLCIGCTICIQKCPVDAIVGAAKRMHTVLAAECIGCRLCIAPCPVDCIVMVDPAPPMHRVDPALALARFRFRQFRLERGLHERAQRFGREAEAELAALEAHAAADSSAEKGQTGQDQPVDVERARKRAVIERAVARAKARQTRANAASDDWLV